MPKARVSVYIEPAVMDDSPRLAIKMARDNLERQLKELGCTEIDHEIRELGLHDVGPEEGPPHFVYVYVATGRKYS